MNAYSLSHLGDASLLKAGAGLVSNERSNTALLLAHIAEIDARKLYLPAAYSSMHAYCIGEWKLSESAANKRIRAARTAREFPVLFDAIAEGRLHLCAVVMFACYFTRANVAELIEAATHRSRVELERLIAERFPRQDVASMLEPVGVPAAAQDASSQLATWPVSLSNAEQAAPPPPAKVQAIAPQRFALQCTLSASTHDKLRYLQSLLSHAIPSGDIPAVLDQVFDTAIAQLEKRKFAATSHPRRAQRPTHSARHIPARVKQAVWKRDGGQCTFTSDDGHRCSSRHRLEFDHVLEVTRGGESTVENVRLRCRAHNQYSAECTFGAGFMAEKREAPRRTRAPIAAGGGPLITTQVDPELGVTPWLRQLGFKASEAKLAAEYCATLPEVSLEQRVKQAIAYLRPRRPQHALVREKPEAAYSVASAIGSKLPTARKFMNDRGQSHRPGKRANDKHQRRGLFGIERRRRAAGHEAADVRSDQVVEPDCYGQPTQGSLHDHVPPAPSAFANFGRLTS